MPTRATESVVQSGMPIRILIADASPDYLSAVRSLAAKHDGLVIVGEARDLTQTLYLASVREPDVVLLDIEVQGMRTDDAISRVLAAGGPRTRAAVVTSTDATVEHQRDGDIRNAILQGATGFLLKENLRVGFVRTVIQLSAGLAVFDPRILQRMATQLGQLRPVEVQELVVKRLSTLTLRERDTLALMGAGLSNIQIEQALGIKLTTVKTHVSNILRKLEVPDRVQAIVIARDYGIAANEEAIAQLLAEQR